MNWTCSTLKIKRPHQNFYSITWVVIFRSFGSHFYRRILKKISLAKMGEMSKIQLGVIGALFLSVASSVSIVICNKALMSNLGFPFGNYHFSLSQLIKVDIARLTIIIWVWALVLTVMCEFLVSIIISLHLHLFLFFY